jgi:acyl-CoA thioesterase FadM
MGYHIATLSLRLDFRCPNVDEEWLVSRTTTKKLQHGIFDMHVDIVNDRGNIIATSTQSWSMVPRRGGSKTMASETKL